MVDGAVIRNDQEVVSLYQGSAQSHCLALAALLTLTGDEYFLLILKRHSSMSTHCLDASCFAPVQNIGFACSRIFRRLVLLPLLCAEWQVGSSPRPPSSATVQVGGNPKLLPFLDFSTVFRGWLGSGCLRSTSVLCRWFTSP